MKNVINNRLKNMDIESWVFAVVVGTSIGLLLIIFLIILNNLEQ